MENKDIIIPIYLYHYYNDNNFFSKISLTEIKETNWTLHKLFYVFSNNISEIIPKFYIKCLRSIKTRAKQK